MAKWAALSYRAYTCTIALLRIPGVIKSAGRHSSTICKSAGQLVLGLSPAEWKGWNHFTTGKTIQRGGGRADPEAGQAWEVVGVVSRLNSMLPKLLPPPEPENPT